MTATAFIKANPDLPPLFIKTVKIWEKLYPSVRFSPPRRDKHGNPQFTISGVPDEMLADLMKAARAARAGKVGRPTSASSRARKREQTSGKTAKPARKVRPAPTAPKKPAAKPKKAR